MNLFYSLNPKKVRIISVESFIHTVSKIFNHGGNVHYVLPHFQREYIWGREQWAELLRDILYIYEESQKGRSIVHFLGLMVMTPEPMLHGTIPQYKVVDGQQRLITLSLIFNILRELARKKKQTHDLADKIDQMVTNYREKGDARFKILPSTRYGDYAIYVSIIDGQVSKAKRSPILEAYNYLYREIRRYIAVMDVSVDKLYEVVNNQLEVAMVILNNDENPYKIFESLDGKGKLLSQADLVRNYIAMTLPANVQERVFEEYWVKIEEILLIEQQKTGRSGELIPFLRHYLAMRRKVVYAEERVYARFRDYMEQEHDGTDAFTQEIGVIYHYAEHYAKFLMPEREPDREVRAALIRLGNMEASIAYPLLLSAYEARYTGQITTKELVQVLTLVENLLVRRYLCGEGSIALFKWFPMVWDEIIQRCSISTFLDACRYVIGGYFYPSDKLLRRSIHVVKLYGGRLPQQRMKIAFILSSIEESLWGHTDVTTQLKGLPTIEHIMPQTITNEWQSELGSNWGQVHVDYLHTLGNLTLVTQGRNSQLSNAPFAEKTRLLLTQGLRLNEYFKDNIPFWNDRAIQNRADWLASHILKVWPSLAPEL